MDMETRVYMGSSGRTGIHASNLRPKDPSSVFTNIGSDVDVVRVCIWDELEGLEFLPQTYDPKTIPVCLSVPKMMLMC